MSTRKILFWFILLAAFSSIAFIMGEVLVRLVVPQYTYRGLRDALGRYYSGSEFNSFTLQINYRGTGPSQEHPGQRVRVSTNSLGLRGREISPEELQASQRILVLGDSYTFGVYVDDHETFCQNLEQELRNEGYRVVVLNAGYANGYETDEEYCWLVNRGIKLKPHIIILGLFHGNDITGIRPATWLQKDDRGLPVAIKNPDLFVQDGFLRTLTLDQKSVGGEFVYKLPVIRESHLCIAISRVVNGMIMNPEKYGPNAVSESFAYLFEEESDEFVEKEQIFLKLVAGMRDTATANRARFMVLMIPFNFEVEPSLLQRTFKVASGSSIKRDYYTELEPKLEALNIPFINLLTEMRKSPQHKYYPRNGEVHLNPEGHRFAAGKLKQFLLGRNWIPNHTDARSKK